MNILLYPIVAFILVFAVACCAVFMLGIPVVIVWKIYRHFRYGTSLYD